MNLHIQFDFDALSLNETFLAHLRGDAWFQEAAAERIIHELDELKERMDRFDDRKVQLMQEFATLLARQARHLSRLTSSSGARELAEIRGIALHLKRRLSDAYQSFLKNSYRRYLPPEIGFGVQDVLIQEMKKNLVDRFECVIKPDMEKGLDVIDSFIRRCQAT